jgi:hypothetical protein
LPGAIDSEAITPSQEATRTHPLQRGSVDDRQPYALWESADAAIYPGRPGQWLYRPPTRASRQRRRKGGPGLAPCPVLTVR